MRVEDTRDRRWEKTGKLRLTRTAVHPHAVIGIHDRELSAREFSRLLTTYAGWSMRIEFVPEDGIHRRPALEVRQPSEQ